MILALLLGTAWAGDVDVTVDDDGTVLGRVELSAPVDEVRSLLGDPERMNRVLKSESQTEISQQGDCILQKTHQPHPIAAVDFVIRTCPTTTGWKTTLVESDDIERMDVEWKLAPMASGTAVTYSLDVESTMVLPDFVERGALKRSATKTLEALVAHFGG